MTGGHRHSQYCLKISGIPGNAWFPQLTVTYIPVCVYLLTGDHLKYHLKYTPAIGGCIVCRAPDLGAQPAQGWWLLVVCLTRS